MIKLKNKKGFNMIYFVICEKNKEDINIYKNEINKVMINHDIDYKFQIFNDYTEKWYKFSKEEKSFKIYLLSLNHQTQSEFNIPKYIRESLDDWQSMIIVLSNNQKSQLKLLNNRWMIIDFILKQNTWQQKLSNSIKIALKNYDKRPKSLKFAYKNTLYNIDFSNIIYIEKELNKKRCLIKTTEGEFYISSNLTDVFKKLDNRFAKCCRSIIINLEQILSYNSKTNTLIFKNKDELNAISRDKKKDLIKYIRGIY